MWSQKEEEEKKEYISAFWNFNYTHGGVEGEGKTIDSLPACSVKRDERSLKSTGTRRFLLSPQFVQWRATAAYLKTAAQAFHCNGILSQRDDRKNDTEHLQSLHSLCQRASMYLFIYFNNSIFWSLCPSFLTSFSPLPLRVWLPVLVVFLAQVFAFAVSEEDCDSYPIYRFSATAVPLIYS